MQKSVIQKYMENPLLIKGKKFDFRSYMLISCVKPFVTFFNEGYVRLSLNDYNMEDFDSKEGKITHLTNNSVQKKHPDYKQLKADSILSIDELTAQLKIEGKIENEAEFKDKILSQMKEIMKLIFHQAKGKLLQKFGCFELLGFDFLIDEDLNLKIIEINVNPALFTGTPVLKSILPKLIDDVIGMTLAMHEKSEMNEASQEKVDSVIKDTKEKYTSFELLTRDE